MPSLVAIALHRRRGGEKRRVFCLSVTLLNVKVRAPDFTMKALEYRNVLMPLDRGRFVVVHPCSTFSYCRQLSTSLNAELPKSKICKIGVFRRQRATE